jgi:hypothetical protein
MEGRGGHFGQITRTGLLQKKKNFVRGGLAPAVPDVFAYSSPARAQNQVDREVGQGMLALLLLRK